MSDFKSFKGNAKKFFVDGKGYYIVLGLCAAVIGVSAYAIFQDKDDLDKNMGEVLEEPDYITPPPIEDVPEEETPIQDEQEIEVLEEIEQEMEEEEEPQQAEETQEETAAMQPQYIWPVSGEIELPYSMTKLVYNEKMGDWRTSDEVSIKVPIGTQVTACGPGSVVSIETDKLNGTTVVLEHPGGLRSVYSNLAALPTVYAGDTVATGEVIGSVGMTALGESSSNAHLCFKMTLDGQSVDPNEYLPPR